MSAFRALVILLATVCLLAVLAPAPADAGQPKQDVCHAHPKKGFLVLSVAAPSVPAHLAHGDHLPLTFWADADGDGFGAGPASTGCVVPAGYVENDDDCDDTNAAVNPAATEVCNTIDDDCDGLVDDDDPSVVGQPTWYADADADGFGDAGSSQLACFQPDGYVSDATDCDDTDGAVNPDATEVCNGLDDDCDGAVDDDDADVADASTWYADDDGDGYGDASDSTEACDQPAGFVADSTDCDDTDSGVNPGATEVCNSVDDDCDGSVDEGGVCAGKRVFVSSQLYDGNFGNGQRVLGYFAADGVCQTLADNAGLGGTWKAWLSGRPDSAGCGSLQPDCDGHGAADRFFQSPGPYVLVNGTQVAASWADLTDGSLDHAIDRTETNLVVSGETRVWTNTTTAGAAWDAGTNCAQGPPTDGDQTLFTWTCGQPSWSPGDCQFQSGKYGESTSTTGSWTGTTSSNISCSNTFRLYCFEQ